MHRRKRRVKCRICNECEIIYDRLCCRECWMLLPLKARKPHIRIWRELQPYINRFDNTVKEISVADRPYVDSLLDAHGDSCDMVIAKMGELHAAKTP